MIRATSVQRTEKGLDGHGPIIGERLIDWLALKAYSARQIWTLSPRTREKVDRRIQTLDISAANLTGISEGQEQEPALVRMARPFCGIHIRRGDKIGTEASKIAVSAYLDAVEKMNISCLLYFLASDDIKSVQQEFRNELKKRAFSTGKTPYVATLNYSRGNPYTDGGYRWTSFLSKDEAGRVENTLDMLAELEVGGMRLTEDIESWVDCALKK